MARRSTNKDSQPPTRHYAIAYDISPSEQIGQKASSKRSLAFALPLGSLKPLEDLGDRFPFRKWNGASAGYKQNFIEFLRSERESDPRTFMTGRSVVNERAIRRTGQEANRRLLGRLPDPISYNKAGKPRICGPNLTIGGESVDAERILVDDLLVICWLAVEMARLRADFEEANRKEAHSRGEKPEGVTMEVLPDRLPRDGSDFYRTKLLKSLVDCATAGKVNVVGLSDQSDTYARDLVADNLAGLSRDIEDGKLADDASKLFSMDRRDTPASRNLELP